MQNEEECGTSLTPFAPYLRPDSGSAKSLFYPQKPIVCIGFAVRADS